MAIDRYAMFPKEILIQEFEKLDPPDFSKEDNPHGILADLDLPIYITTNYDNFMFNALKARNIQKNPKRTLSLE